MKITKIVIFVLVFSILAISTWNTIQLKKCKRNFEKQKSETSRQKKLFKVKENAIINSRLVSMKYLGRILTWSNIKKVFPKGDAGIELQKNPKLAIIFSEFGCNVCQDSETKFAVDISDSFGDNFVLAIVQAGNKRYVGNYIRQNQVNFPVYFCEDDSFFVLNDFLDTPLIFILDKDDRIIASHLPIPGYPEYSEPIHQFCIYYLKQYIAKN